MRSGYLWLASFVVYPLVGTPLLRLPAFRRFGFATRVVLAGGVGLVLVSWTMTAFALTGVRWGPPLLLVSVAVAFALRRALRGYPQVPSPRVRGEGQGEGRSSPSPLWGEGRGEGRPPVTTVAGLAITAISILAAFAATLSGLATSSDLLLFWGPKAQQFAAARTIDVDFLRAPFLEYLHVYYPPLVTNVFAFGATITGRFPWGAATLTFPLLLAATAVGLAGILKTESNAPSAAATTALVTSAIGLLGVHAMVAGNADPFLLFFEILALALLLTPIAASDAGKLAAGLLLAGAAGSKVEGLAFLLATVSVFLLVDRERRGSIPKTLLLLAGPTLVGLGTWFGFGAARRLFYGYQGYGRFLDVRWDHLDEMVAGFGSAFWKSGYALPFAVPLLVLLLTPGKTRRALVPIGIAVALTGFIAFTYLHGETDPKEWIGWSAARVFSPITALLALTAHCSRAAPDAGDERTA
ncbi:MAG: hypothetical protein M3542_10285 [Acidobacteriota bacterium]|nr:hypothetical protein [Acidobacteriota bacterium]